MWTSMEMLRTNETWVFPYCFLAFAVTLGDETETSLALSPVGQVAVQAPSHCGDSARTCALADGWGRKDQSTPKPQTG